MSEQTIPSETYQSMKEFNQQLVAQQEWPEGELKQVLVDYVGENNDSEEVTVELIVETMAKEFPEFLMMVAEENFLRGYQQAIHDVDEGQKLLAAHAEETEAPAE